MGFEVKRILDIYGCHSNWIIILTSMIILTLLFISLKNKLKTPSKYTVKHSQDA
jgi:hypothetical protein